MSLESNATAPAWGDACLHGAFWEPQQNLLPRGAAFGQGGGCATSTPRPGWTIVLHDACPHTKDIVTLALAPSEARTGRACWK